MMLRLLVGALLLATAPSGAALQLGGVSPQRASRRAAVGFAALAVLPHAARAGGSGNTKDDKAFQECLSKCVYEKTKITKGIAQVEVVSRTEAYAECKPKCAVNKDQLLIGKAK